jgi:hypothetical protein
MTFPGVFSPHRTPGTGQQVKIFCFTRVDPGNLQCGDAGRTVILPQGSTLSAYR